MSFYKPSNQSAGRTIDTAAAAGATGGGQNPYAKIDPLAHLRGLVDGGGAGSLGAGSGIRWDMVGNSRYEDDGLRALRGEVNTEELVNQEYIQKYSEAAAAFFQSLVQRRGGMYGEYRAVLEHFKYNKKTGALCHIRSAFVDTINRHPEFMVVLAKAGVPVFGQILIDMAKVSQSGNLNESEYRKACQMASSMVLTMELLSWLTKSIEGREKSYALTAEIKQMIGDIERFKDSFTQACTTFGLTNPYAGLVFEVSSPTRADNSMIVEAERALQGLTHFGGNSFMNNQPQADASPLFEQIFSTAQQARDRYVPDEGTQYNDAFGQVAWETKEVDFSRITEENKKHYDYRRLFQWIGKDNWYFIPEADWKKVKHAFKRHPDQPEQEDSVLSGSFRVVKIDLDADDGWFSTVVRGEGLDMATGFTDPRKLLPLLEGVEGSTETQVIAAVSAEKLLGKSASASIPVAVCEQLEGIPVITLKDEISETSSGAILAAISSTNKVLTANVKGTNATSFKTCIWEYFNCDSAEDREKITKNLPFLFKDQEDTNLSFFMRVKKMVNFFDTAVIDDELVDYVDRRLTLMVNDWLINSLGYNNNPEHHLFLAIESIFEDYSELDNIFKESDEEAFRCFNMEGTPVNFLTEQMKIFVSESPHNKVLAKDSIVDKVQKGLRLVTERPIHFTIVNKRLPPSDIDQGNDPILIRRSKFPEFFHLVESGFGPSMGKGKEIKVVDKIIQFSQDDSMWLFSYSSLDINMATMRRVTTRRSLLMMALV